ncbi:MAG: arsenosugar biosynthesis radical SAM protein ArsS, partial [Chloroflexi bacterium]|nr:arsenosugar biosynthesis radical SAM protein ArsS [Chloroflexota bacterium]
MTRRPLETLQINVGKLCNQACHHCHVEAGPKRTEIMEWPVIERLLELTRSAPEVRTVDITGGAPELNPHFRTLVTEMRGMGKQVIDRCNLTVLFEPGQESTARFLARQNVSIIASLPCYSRKNVDEQRGRGVFEKSIRALRSLNRLGYGRQGSGLQLDLVYNPVGAFLPPPQEDLETDYKQRLFQDYAVEFNHLYTITNMPIKRFLHQLKGSGQLDDYMTVLANSFNARAAHSVMCRSLVSIGWDGQIYDCDFNQMLDIPAARKRRTIWDIKSLAEFNQGAIAFDAHCYGCTAGSGSSCGGALV